MSVYRARAGSRDVYKRQGEKPELGSDVAVIGGGNVAIDVARTAVRLGAENVTIIYRRGRDEMPAAADEVAEAEEEGVKFRFLSAPAEVLGDGKCQNLKLEIMELGLSLIHILPAWILIRALSTNDDAIVSSFAS